MAEFGNFFPVRCGGTFSRILDRCTVGSSYCIAESASAAYSGRKVVVLLPVCSYRYYYRHTGIPVGPYRYYCTTGIPVGPYR